MIRTMMMTMIRNHMEKIEMMMINQETMIRTTMMTMIRNHMEKIEMMMINQETTLMTITNTTMNQQNIQSTQKRDTTAMIQSMEWIMIPKTDMEKMTGTNQKIAVVVSI